MGDLVAVCLVCHTRMTTGSEEDQKRFETHYETHHRRRQTTAVGGANECQLDTGEQWEFIMSEDLPTVSTVVRPAEIQTCRKSGAHRNVVEVDLSPNEKLPTEQVVVQLTQGGSDLISNTKAIEEAENLPNFFDQFAITSTSPMADATGEKLPTEKAVVQLDSNQNRMELDSIQGSREQLANRSIEIDSDDTQLITDVLSENITKVPRREEIRKVPLLVKMKNFVEETLVGNHSADTIAELEKTKSIRIESVIDQVVQQSTATQKLLAKGRNFGPFKCRRCHKTFADLRKLQFHCRTHVECAECAQILALKPHLREHFYTHLPVHPVRATICCQECDSKFSSRIYLQRHLKRIHPTEADLTWICSHPNCNKRFGLKTQLDQHAHGHSKVFYSCRHCQTKFKFPHDLGPHRRLKHSAVPFTKYRCGQCPKMFFTRSDLVQHRFSHSQKPNFPCYECGFILTTNSKRLAHFDLKHKITD